MREKCGKFISMSNSSNFSCNHHYCQSNRILPRIFFCHFLSVIVISIEANIKIKFTQAGCITTILRVYCPIPIKFRTIYPILLQIYSFKKKSTLFLFILAVRGLQKKLILMDISLSLNFHYFFFFFFFLHLLLLLLLFLEITLSFILLGGIFYV